MAHTETLFCTKADKWAGRKLLVKTREEFPANGAAASRKGESVVGKSKLLFTAAATTALVAGFVVAMKSHYPTPPIPPSIATHPAGLVPRGSGSNAGDSQGEPPLSAPANPEATAPAVLGSELEEPRFTSSTPIPMPTEGIAAAIRRSDQLIAAGESLLAHRALSDLYRVDQLPSSDRAALQLRLEPLGQALFFQPGDPATEPPYTIRTGELLGQIARRWNVSWQYLQRLNGIDARRIRAGQNIKVVRGPFEAVVDLSDLELTVFANGLWVRTYRVGTGKNDSTPVGGFQVLDKVENPPYNGPEGNFAPDDPDNPVGEHWIALGGGYGIHGTIVPESIGRQQSSGCIRMLPADVAEVFDLLVTGSSVRIRP